MSTAGAIPGPLDWGQVQYFLAVAEGGSVATREVDGQPVPEHAVYRVVYTVDARPAALAGQVWRGRVVTEARAESVLQGLAREFMVAVAGIRGRGPGGQCRRHQQQCGQQHPGPARGGEGWSGHGKLYSPAWMNLG